MTALDDINTLRDRMGLAIIGQREVVDRLLIGLVANGNLLLEGLPGLAKTRAVKALAKNMECAYSRIQFTPDLLPADVTGTEMYMQGAAEGEQFKFQPGPIFANIVLADEINRAPAKVQAALLEAMEERQVTVAGTTHKMDPLFMVLATQNPIEQEGTYPLPEAQMDRFLMHVVIHYPPLADEIEVIRLVRGEEQKAILPKEDAAPKDLLPPISQDAVFAARREVAAVHCSEEIETYMATLVHATRAPADFSETLARWLELGASPRGSLALDRCARCHAWMAGRDYVDPQDVRAIAPDVLRHRIGLSYEAQGEGITADQAIAELLSSVAVP